MRNRLERFRSDILYRTVSAGLDRGAGNEEMYLPTKAGANCWENFPALPPWKSNPPIKFPGWCTTPCFTPAGGCYQPR